MQVWPGVLALLAGAIAAAVLVASDDGDGEPSPEPQAATEPPRCPLPEVTELSVRRASPDGHRVRLHVTAVPNRGRITSFLLRWGDGEQGGVIFQSGSGTLSLPLITHRYRRPGAYRVSVVAEALSRRCDQTKSEPATLRVRIPLTTTSPSSP
jgi:hypothetical protein